MPRKASKRVKTLKSFIEWVEQFNDGEYVFRGVSNEKYIIEASTYRRLKDKDGNFKKEEDGTPEKLLKINEEMIEDARRHGHGGDMTDLELLAELQHRGAATCLMDFTQNPLVALWMACRESSRGAAHGKVFAVDISSQVTFQPVTSELAQKKKIGYFFQRNENKGYQLYQWQPNYQNNRMLAQQSIFLFGSAEIELAAECTILKNGKYNLRASLEKSAQITEGNLFPDFDGFASQRAQNKTYIEPDAQYYWMRGLYAYTEGKIDEAIDYYSKGISLNPDKIFLTMCHVGRAFVNEMAKNYNLAIKDYNKVMALRPDYPGIYLDRGLSKAQLKQHKEAIADYNEAIRLNPDEALAYYNRGLSKVQLEQYQEAIADYNEAIRLKSDYEFVYNDRGDAKYHIDHYEEAIADYNEAIRLKPDEALAYYNRGLSKVQLKQHKEAIADYNEAIRLKPDEAPLYYSRGLSKVRLEQYQEAIADYDEAIRLNPDDAITYQARGFAKFELGQYEEVIADCNEAIRLNPDGATAYLLHGLAESELGHLSEAQQDFQTALQLSRQIGNKELTADIEQHLREIDPDIDESDSEDE